MRESMKKFHGNFLCQPYTVRRKIEGVTGPRHSSGGNLIDNRFSVPCSYGNGRIHIFGKMDIKPAFGDQAGFLNGSRIFLPCAGPKQFRRDGLR